MKKYFLVTLFVLGGLFWTADLYAQALSGKELDKAVKRAVKARQKEV